MIPSAEIAFPSMYPLGLRVCSSWASWYRIHTAVSAPHHREKGVWGSSVDAPPPLSAPQVPACNGHSRLLVPGNDVISDRFPNTVLTPSKSYSRLADATSGSAANCHIYLHPRLALSMGPTDLQAADVLTKALGHVNYEQFVIGMGSEVCPTEGAC